MTAETEFDFSPLDWKDMVKAAETQAHFIIDGMISATSTLLYGEAKVGKSYIVSALIASLAMGRDFLGRGIESRGWNVAICATDDGAAAEYGQRIQTVVPEGVNLPVRCFQLPVMRSRAMWESLYRQIIRGGFNFVVIDNLTQAAGGSVNDDGAIRDFFEGVRMFTRAGIPVVIVGHSSEKSGERGKSNLPMGSSAISQSVRHRCFVSRSRGRLSLRFSGNHVEPHTVLLEHGTGARFTVVDRQDAEAVKADGEAKRRDRDKATLDKNAVIAAYVVSDCQGMGVRKTAQSLADRFGGAASTYSSNLSSKRAYGAMLTRGDGDSWALAVAA
ncbi:AAA family ATPase [Streptomyces sp. NPDC001380]|uniref:AAA family ATPase n=1 Tax=Streptomyces sp. NPDC001380 TaxID=3364566 RepID=UPI00367C4591